MTMELPQPPADIELRNIIDKLAQFVARNGPEFEMMTKNKQKGNPKFSFLFGGDHFNYYQYKVTTEQAILKVKAVRDNIPAMTNQPPQLAGVSGNQPSLQAIIGQVSSFGSASTGPTPAPTATPMQIINAAASAAQWLVNHQGGQGQANILPSHAPPSSVISVEGIIEQQNILNQQITQSEQNLAAQHSVLMQNLQTQIEESLRKSQNESLVKRAEEYLVNLTEFDSVLQPIIDSCTKDSISSGKAWILGKNTSEAHEVIAQYLLSKVLATVHPVQFTQKLHIIYLINDVMHHCVRKNAHNLKKSLQDVVVPMFCNTSIGITEEQLNKLNKLVNLWETKSNYFSKDILTKLKTPESSWKEYQEDIVALNSNIVNPLKQAMKASFDNYQAQHQAFVSHALQQIQTLETQKLQIEQSKELQSQFQPTPDLAHCLPLSIPDNPDVSLLPHAFDAPPPPIISNPPPPMDGLNFNQPPPLFQHLPPDLIPDFSRPPPGFNLKEPPAVDELMPSVPYFELPAGLMVPLIKLDDTNYKPLDSQKMRLPPAVPPTDRLIQAVESFYQRNNGNTRERLILDADGWEKLGLYEYYKAKNAARKTKEDDICKGLRERTRSPSPIIRAKSRSRSPKKKRYRSRSRSRSKSKEKEAEDVRSRSRSPGRHHRSSNGKKSPRKSSSSKTSRRSRSKSRSPSPPSKNTSPSPLSFLGANYGKTMEQQIDETNKGHQMLKKMGWSGSGLGSKEQGIEAPISGGEVRDKVDQYKGVGVNLHDPYEHFRKSKGQAFITRMKARAEERMSTT